MANPPPPLIGDEADLVTTTTTTTASREPTEGADGDESPGPTEAEAPDTFQAALMDLLHNKTPNLVWADDDADAEWYGTPDPEPSAAPSSASVTPAHSAARPATGRDAPSRASARDHRHHGAGKEAAWWGPTTHGATDAYWPTGAKGKKGGGTHAAPRPQKPTKAASRWVQAVEPPAPAPVPPKAASVWDHIGALRECPSGSGPTGGASTAQLRDPSAQDWRLTTPAPADRFSGWRGECLAANPFSRKPTSGGRKHW